MINHAEAGFFINKIGNFAEKNIVKTNESIIKRWDVILNVACN